MVREELIVLGPVDKPVEHQQHLSINNLARMLLTASRRLYSGVPSVSRKYDSGALSSSQKRTKLVGEGGSSLIRLLIILFSPAR